MIEITCLDAPASLARTSPSGRPAPRVGVVQHRWQADSAAVQAELNEGIGRAARLGASVVFLPELTLSRYPADTLPRGDWHVGAGRDKRSSEVGRRRRGGVGGESCRGGQIRGSCRTEWSIRGWLIGGGSFHSSHPRVHAAGLSTKTAQVGSRRPRPALCWTDDGHNISIRCRPDGPLRRPSRLHAGGRDRARLDHPDDPGGSIRYIRPGPQAIVESSRTR